MTSSKKVPLNVCDNDRQHEVATHKRHIIIVGCRSLSLSCGDTFCELFMVENRDGRFG